MQPYSALNHHQYQRDVQHREPPPYPGHLKHLYQPGYRQSYSGSETSTDISLSSSENLSTSARQDPQGEETTAPVLLHLPDSIEGDNTYSILSRLGLPATAVEVRSTNSGTFYVTGSMHPQTSTTSINSPLFLHSQQPIPSISTTSSACTVASQQIYANLLKMQQSMISNTPQRSTSPSIRPEHQYLVERTIPPTEALLPPPPSYPGTKNLPQPETKEKKELRRSYEMLDRPQLTRSQPDLTRLAELQGRLAGSTTTESSQYSQHQGIRKQTQELDHVAIANRATQMVELLSEENRSLREELEGYYRKVSKLQKVEMEIQKIHESHDALVKHSQRRENLEKAMRYKLEQEIHRLRESNRNMKDQLDGALSQPKEQVYSSPNLSDSELKKELGRKDAIIAKLLTQTRELTAAKERLEIEVAAQRSTLQEQRTHIDVLDNALTNAQTHVVRFEEERRKRQAQEEKVDDLQKALSQLQAATEKRQSIEQMLRGKLEEEIRCLKNPQAGLGKTSDTDEGISSDSESPTSIQSLIRQMQEKEQKILHLEAELVRWEQRFLEESAMRQLAIDAVSCPKDARIAALEQSSIETEKMITDARIERLKHLEEVYQANRKVAELESKLRTTQAQLAEKDAMIKVLHRHSNLSRTSSVVSLLCSPMHSPRPSLTSPLSSSPVSALSSTSSSRQSSQLDTNPSYMEAKVPNHVKTSSTGSMGSTTSSTTSPSKEAPMKELQQKLVTEAVLRGAGLQSSPEQVSKCLWQV